MIAGPRRGGSAPGDRPLEGDARAAVRQARRVVLKIGSRALSTDAAVFTRLALAIAASREAGREVVVVSSGAIALGVKKLGYRARPREMAKLQAAAAAGQSVLMRAWEEALGGRGIPVAQVLLTHADLADRVRANNASAALLALLDAGAVPVLNENDSVAVDEIRFGDNDALSSMVVPLVGADLLILLSDVEGLLDRSGQRVPCVRDVAGEALPLVRSGKSDVGSGGMASKLEAARRAVLAGASVVLADARREGVIQAILAGEDVGTLFAAARTRLSARRHWIAFTLRPKGDLVLDAGARAAVERGNKSVLSVGVLGVRGDFEAEDSVRLLTESGAEIARGLVRCDVRRAAALAGRGKEAGSEVLVHRDDLVVLQVQHGEKKAGPG